MGARLLLPFLLLVPAAAASGQDAPPEPSAGPSGLEERAARARAGCVEEIDRATRLFHLPAEHLDREAVCDEIAAQARQGVPRRQLVERIRDAIRRAQYHFATPGATHDRGARYRLPFEIWVPRLVSQTSDGPTHQGFDQRHAFDFLMPIGTKVLAARGGTVVRVGDGTPEGVPAEEDGGNFVTVLHPDGTWAVYAHLRAGIPVSVGQTVKRGELLAFSGNTGLSETPHLHLGVQRLTEEGEVQALPVRFGQPGTPGFELEAGRHWGTAPESRRELRVFVDGERSRPDAAIPAGYGSRHPLRVELVAPDGSVRDVTHDPRLRYETMTVWNLHSPAPGQVAIEALPEIDPAYVRRALPLLNQGQALLFVYHGEPWDADFGMARVTFQVLPASPGP